MADSEPGAHCQRTGGCMSINLGPQLIGTSPAHAALIAGLLVAVTVPLALRAGQREAQPWLPALLMGSLLLHFFGSVLQIVVVRVAYDNVADFNGYNRRGADLAAAWDNGTFDLSGLLIPGTGTIDVITGVIFTVVGVDQLGAFFVFSWLAFLGLMAFYRAFRIAMPTAQHGRYAAAIFLLPSLFYWPSATGKEAVMMLALGLMVLGAALVFNSRWSGVLPLAAGTVLGGLIRPHEVALLFGAFGAAILTRRAVRHSLITPVRWVVTLVVVGLFGVVLARVTADFLGLTTISASALVETINDTNEALQGEGTGFESSYATWNASPLYFPYDVYLVLFKPLPFEVRSGTQAFAAVENLTIMALIAASWRSLAAVPRQLRQSPFLVMCLLYSVGFLYVFSALGNVGLLARERTLLFPLLFVLFTLSTTTVRTNSLGGHSTGGRSWSVPAVLTSPPFPRSTYESVDAVSPPRG
ncbi:MAG: hypothetical protein H0V23_12180 [Nocardioidaceae bacterium]|nr:hypothetical protein [Nocardioidaceae bacterium]